MSHHGSGAAHVEVRVVGKPDRLLERAFERLMRDVVERKVREALQAALQLLATARDQALAQIDRELDRILREAEERVKTHESMLDAKLKVEIAEFKARIVEEVVSEVLRQLRNYIPPERYEEMIRGWLRDALEGIKPYAGKVVVQPAKPDHDLVAKLAPQVGSEVGVEVSIGSDVEGLGGFIASTPDGSVSFDYRLEVVLQEAIDRAKARVMEVLFGGKG